MMPKHRMVHLLITGTLLGVLVLAACGSATTEDQSPVPNVPEEANRAIADLAKRLDIDADRIEIVRVESVEWPDTSLGCPRPGQAYAQVITPGHIVVLSANGQEYEYHTGGDQIIACEP